MGGRKTGQAWKSPRAQSCTGSFSHLLSSPSSSPSSLLLLLLFSTKTPNRGCVARAVAWKCQLLPKAGDWLPQTPHPAKGLCLAMASPAGVGQGSPTSWKPFYHQLVATGSRLLALGMCRQGLWGRGPWSDPLPAGQPRASQSPLLGCSVLTHKARVRGAGSMPGARLAIENAADKHGGTKCHGLK